MKAYSIYQFVGLPVFLSFSSFHVFNGFLVCFITLKSLYIHMSFYLQSLPWALHIFGVVLCLYIMFFLDMDKRIFKSDFMDLKKAGEI